MVARGGPDSKGLAPSPLTHFELSCIGLLCILVDNNFGRAFGDVFLVEVPSNGPIGHLKQKIKEDNNDLPPFPRVLEVWRLRNPRGSSAIFRGRSAGWR
jgi:hypothetical protein